jgi:hypothetical protein
MAYKQPDPALRSRLIDYLETLKWPVRRLRAAALNGAEFGLVLPFEGWRRARPASEPSASPSQGNGGGNVPRFRQPGS